MSYLYLTILFPLIGFLLLASIRDRLSENLAAVIGVGAMGLSALTALWVGIDFNQHAQAGVPIGQLLWTWVRVGDFAPAFGLSLDGLSLTMLGVVTGVGFLIHIFASWYMRGEVGYARFFSYFNLFVASMLLLVLGDNLMLLYLGWEGVGICSYLLIGFYFQDRANGKAAMKAFTVTRVGDIFLALGLFILFREMGTLNIHEIITRAPQVFTSGSYTVNLAALMILGGAVGKSAQIPLQTWLADAMAGPTPVSALIHAATMVTAGVYLIARLHPVFLQAPDILLLVGSIGAVTLVIAGFSALVQTDIKRVLAYSTMSQIGYMFLALGVGAWQASIFHLMTHAFFKALLFLSSGAVILAVHHEQNILKMGGLRKTIPFVYWCFIIGGGALAALPFVTVGFYSKDAILWEAYASGNMWLFWAGVSGAFMTSLYTFRLIWLVFHGQEKTHAHAIKGETYWLPLGILLILSTAVGALIHPPLAGVLPNGAGTLLELAGKAEGKEFVEIVAIASGLSGLLVGIFFYALKPALVASIGNSWLGQGLTVWFKEGWGFDALYELLFVKPYLFIAQKLSKDPVDRLWNIAPWLMNTGHRLANLAQTGSIRDYVIATGFGGFIVLLSMMILQVLGH